MRQLAIPLICIAGLASSVWSQNFSLSLVPSVQTLDTSGGAVTMTISVIADADIGDYILTAMYGIQTDHASVIDMEWIPGDWTSLHFDGMHTGHGNYSQVASALLFTGAPFPPPPSALLGNPIGAFSMTFEEGAVGEVFIDIVGGDPFTMETFIIDIGFPDEIYNSSTGNVSLNGTTVNLVPAPGAAVMSVLFGAVGLRRRR